MNIELFNIYGLIFLAIIILKILNKWRKKMLYNSLGILILEMENM